MNLQEFKAWFEGFTESLECCPNEKQWNRIKARVSEIDGKEITERVYINRYYPYTHYYPYYYSQQPSVYENSVFCGAVASDALSISDDTSLSGYNYMNNGLSGAGDVRYMNCSGSLQNDSSTDTSFNSHNAMYALGKNDFID